MAFVFTPAEQVPLSTILEDSPGTLPSQRLAPILANLSHTDQGLVTTDAQADDDTF